MLSNLVTGQYAVETGPQTEQAKRVLTIFAEKDLKAIGRDFECFYWPGGVGEEMVQPVTVVSSASVHVGELRVRRVPYYNAHVNIPALNCEPGEMVRINEIVLKGLSSRSGPPLSNVPCGKDILITGVPPTPDDSAGRRPWRGCRVGGER